MAIDFEHDPRFQSMNPQKLQMIRELLNEASKKNKEELTTFLLQANVKAQAQGLQFTDEETAILTEAILKDMTPAEIRRFELMKRMIDRFVKQNRT